MEDNFGEIKEARGILSSLSKSNAEELIREDDDKGEGEAQEKEAITAEDKEERGADEEVFEAVGEVRERAEEGGAEATAERDERAADSRANAGEGREGCTAGD